MDAPKPQTPNTSLPITDVPTAPTPDLSAPISSGEGSTVATWIAGGATAIGASHVRRQQPNQDAVMWSPAAAAYAVMAVSDGHGSAAHFRSEIGSRLAVEVAEAILADAAADPAWIAARDTAQARQFAARIVDAWRERVVEHLAAVPLAPEGNSRHDGDARFLPYGATLVACAATPAGLFLLQLGDGDLLLGAPDGTIVRPLPSDEGLVGEQTYSLCQADAEQRIRLRIVTPDEYAADFVILATDGLSKSYADEAAFLRLAGSWRQTIAERGPAAVVQELDGWLGAASQQGSGDDITLGFVVRSASAPAGLALAPDMTAPPLPSGGRRAAVLPATAPISAAGAEAAPAVALTPDDTAPQPARVASRQPVARTAPSGHFGLKLGVMVLLLAAIAAACYYYYAKRVLPVAATPASTSAGALPARGTPASPSSASSPNVQPPPR